jgi:hypothetical protein
MTDSTKRMSTEDLISMIENVDTECSLSVMHAHEAAEALEDRIGMSALEDLQLSFDF